MKRVGMMGALVALVVGAGAAQASELPANEQAALQASVDADAKQLSDTALKIWQWAEVGYQENQSSALLQSRLKAAGFTIDKGVAGMPTAFVARYKRGNGGPVIGLIAEYDALPGLAQKAEPVHAPIAGQIAGHACGHNVFGAASVTAAIAVKQWMDANKVDGELRLYGSPAEEGGSGKVYLVRAGLFNDVDTVLHWHPGSGNGASQARSLANISGKFRFKGVSAHAAASPWRGLSALDGVEVMNVAVNYLREHIPDGTRIHYVVTDGGKAPNVVPDFAESYYYVRHVDPQIVKDVMARVQKAAEGAALATGTSVTFEATGGVYSMLPNATLATVMDRNLRKVKWEPFTPAEIAFAENLQKTLTVKKPLSSATEVEKMVIGEAGGGSTDVADISWTVPTVGLGTAVWVPGTAAHSWQAVAASGNSYGMKGGVVAAKTLALTTAELFRSPDVIAAAKAEFQKERGPDFKYEAMVGNRQPPLDYRKTKE